MTNIADIINPSQCYACLKDKPILKGNCCNECHMRFKCNKGVHGKAKYRLTTKGFYCIRCEFVVTTEDPYQSTGSVLSGKYIKSYCHACSCEIKRRWYAENVKLKVSARKTIQKKTIKPTQKLTWHFIDLSTIQPTCEPQPEFVHKMMRAVAMTKYTDWPSFIVTANKIN